MSAHPYLTNASIRGFKAHTINDQLKFLCDPDRVRVPAFQVIERMQSFTPGEQLLGIAVALTALCQASDINLSDVMSMAQNFIAEANRDPYGSHLGAIRDYAAHELSRYSAEEATKGITPEILMEKMGQPTGKVTSIVPDNLLPGEKIDFKSSTRPGYGTTPSKPRKPRKDKGQPRAKKLLVP